MCCASGEGVSPGPFGSGAGAPPGPGGLWHLARDSSAARAVLPPTPPVRTRHRGKTQTAAAVTHQRAFWRLTQRHKNELSLNITSYSQLNHALQKETASPTIYPNGVAAQRCSEGTVKIFKRHQTKRNVFLMVSQ